MREVQPDPQVRRSGPVSRAGLLGGALLLGLLVALEAAAGLGPAGWVAGVTCGLVGNLWLAAALARHGRTRLGPADLVTLTRATLACGVAALVADALTRSTQVATLVTVAGVALVLDWVDGRVARRTGTVTRLGARFDLEVDAFLILVLSLHVAQHHGAWVVLVGLASYALLAARALVPWLRRPAPARYWCKVVAATQGVVLTAVATEGLPEPLATTLLLLALALLVESFGREVLWLARTRNQDEPVPEPTMSHVA